ncbi:hypothetical protein VTL71DRAFT_1396 [Oculimacula yallundae]|uniref:2EXR domain-containing protein n=1 Tax=Oculimacula yallundae TaxID=86028 RepID=A0ABR4CBD0_9HELO
MHRSLTSPNSFHEESVHPVDVPKEMMDQCLSATLNGTSTVSSDISPASFDDDPAGDSHDSFQDFTSGSNDSVDTQVNVAGNASTTTLNLPVNITKTVSTTAELATTQTSWVPLTEFHLFRKMPLELRRMVVKEAMPAPAIIVLNHETLYYPSHSQEKRTVRYIPEFSMIFSLADLRTSRCLSLAKVNTEFRDVYLKGLPHHIKICQARRERKESKLRFSDKDLLYLSSFFGRIPLDRTFDAISNTPAPALPFQNLTRLAFPGKILSRLADSESALVQFLNTFPRLKEIKVLDHDIQPKPGFKKYCNGGSHGDNPEPETTDYLQMDEHWTVQVDVIANMVKNIAPLLAREDVAVPKFTFL